MNPLNLDYCAVCGRPALGWLGPNTTHCQDGHLVQIYAVQQGPPFPGPLLGVPIGPCPLPMAEYLPASGDVPAGESWRDRPPLL